MKNIVAAIMLALAGCVAVPVQPVVEQPVLYWEAGVGYYWVYQGRRWGYYEYYRYHYPPSYRPHYPPPPGPRGPHRWTHPTPPAPGWRRR